MNAGAPEPKDVVLGIVGDGLGSLQVYSAAIYLGFEPEHIGIFGSNANPVNTYQQFAWNLGQTVLRSESESHFLPADFPTFAQLDALAHRNPALLMRSIGRTFNPGVGEILTEATVVARELGYPQRLIGGRRVGWVSREPGPAPHFTLYDEDANQLGRARHVMLAVGHGPLAFPGVYGAAREDPAVGDRIVQAYEPKSYFTGGRYLVVGSGIASVNEWANVIEAGAECIAMRRNPTPEEQDLNVPRCLFEGSGIDAFQSLDFDERIAFLGRALRGTAPARRGWAEVVARGRAERRFEEFVGDAVAIAPGPAGLRVTLQPYGGGPTSTIDATGIVCGTGFVKSALSIPVLRRLVQSYDVPVERERIRLDSNCGVPPLDMPESRLCMMGLNANTVVPNGDTIAGLKYIARRFVGDVARAEQLRMRPLPARMGMQLRLASKAAAAMRQVRAAEQIT